MKIREFENELTDLGISITEIKCKLGHVTRVRGYSDWKRLEWDHNGVCTDERKKRVPEYDIKK